MKKLISAVFFILIMTLSLNAKWDMDWAEGNEFHITTTNYSIIGHNVLTGTTGGYWPAGYPNENYLYGSGIWFGALIDTISGNYDTLVTAGYNPCGSGAGEFCPGDGDDAPFYTDPYDIVYNSNEANWWWSGAPSYKPDDIISDQDTWCEYNDLDATQHFTSDNHPIGIIARQSTYTFNFNDMIKNMVFIKTQFINVRSDMKTWENCYIAMNIDADIGNESGSDANDLLGFIDTMTTDYANHTDTLVRPNLGYVFQLTDEPGWSHTPGILGCAFLQTPVADRDIDLYHDGSYMIHEGDRIGLTCVNYFTIATDPSTKEERYQAIAGFDHLVFNPSNPYASYTPFPSWGTGSAGYPGQSQDPSTAGDKRMLVSSGPFNSEYGDTVTFVFVYFIAPEKNDILPYTLFAQQFWNNAFGNKVTLISPDDNEQVSGNIKFEWVPLSDKQYFQLELTGIDNSNHYILIGRNDGSVSPDPGSIADGTYNWNMTNYNDYYLESYSDSRTVIIGNSGINDNNPVDDIRFSYLLSGNTLQYTVTGIKSTELCIYDISGREIEKLYSGALNGTYSSSVILGMDSGVYFIKDKLNTDIKGKIILIR